MTYYLIWTLWIQLHVVECAVYVHIYIYIYIVYVTCAMLIMWYECCTDDVCIETVTKHSLISLW